MSNKLDEVIHTPQMKQARRNLQDATSLIPLFDYIVLFNPSYIIKHASINYETHTCQILIDETLILSIIKNNYLHTTYFPIYGEFSALIRSLHEHYVRTMFCVEGSSLTPQCPIPDTCPEAYANFFVDDVK